MKTKKFFTKLAIIVIAIFLGDFIVGKTLEWLYFSQSHGRLYTVTQAFEKRAEQVFILGSSRAQYHYNPEVIAPKLHKTTYNAGLSGQSILYTKTLLDVLTERHRPEIIILDVQHSEFVHSQLAYDRLNNLGPYASRHPQVWNTLSLRSSTEKLRHLSRIYPYNSLLIPMVVNNIGLDTREFTENGFLAKKGVWTGEKFKPSIDAAEKLDQNKLDAFTHILDLCRQKDIRLYVVISPIYFDFIEDTPSMRFLQSELEARQIPLISYINDKAFADPKLFFDALHLNGQGADKFSANIAELIAQLEQEQGN